MIETCNYLLSLSGKTIGSHVVRTQKSYATVQLESKLMLHVSSQKHLIYQQSRLYNPNLQSLYFVEESQDLHEKREFSVHFDRESGLVKVSRGRNDHKIDYATAPYISPYQDPLGLLYYLRQMPTDTEHIRVPMLGKDVTIRFSGEEALTNNLGKHQVRVYDLQPGGSYVYVAVNSPHYIVKMLQKVDYQMIEANLMSVSHESFQAGRKSRQEREGRVRYEARAPKPLPKDRDYSLQAILHQSAEPPRRDPIFRRNRSH